MMNDSPFDAASTSRDSCARASPMLTDFIAASIGPDHRTLVPNPGPINA